jgi:hypothetical protein
MVTFTPKEEWQHIDDDPAMADHKGHEHLLGPVLNLDFSEVVMEK